ncbi:MAG: SPOR domain-containing protein, partial [Candidatus Omnitrophica bacterium]|nr:SPOR domain-containing protein [Candidatus Omnitrophota bacterium]
QIIKEETSAKGYTIQVASFKFKNEALKEMESLKRRGFNSIILNKGTFLIVCVGKYSDKEKAISVLQKLKKNYQDSFVRRL